MLSQFLSQAVDFAWGLPLVILLLGGGIYLAIISRFLPLTGFVHALRLVLGKFHHKGDEQDKGQISHLQALTNALSSTVGMGNIAGVAVAISQGGAGAIFWMWVAGLIGMNTKFFECTLAVMYRGEDYTGEAQGGPMYVIEKALHKKLIPLAYAFAFFGMCGMTPLFNTNQLASYASSQIGLSPYFLGFMCSTFVAVILIGGIKSIGKVTEKLVPLMCGVYVFSCLIIIFLNLNEIPNILLSIFKEAFSGRAAIGGVEGLAVSQILSIGIKRAAFSNEAGIGSAPMAHSNAKTTEPIAEGLVAMLGPFIDTIVVCTMTAIVILLSIGKADTSGMSDILLTSFAVKTHLANFGEYALGFAILLFSASTILGTANYMQKCWNYIFKGRFGLGNKTFIGVYCSVVMIGAISSSNDVINFLDLCFALMAIPNMIATLSLAPKVKMALNKYWKTYLQK